MSTMCLSYICSMLFPISLRDTTLERNKATRTKVKVFSISTNSFRLSSNIMRRLSRDGAVEERQLKEHMVVGDDEMKSDPQTTQSNH